MRHGYALLFFIFHCVPVSILKSIAMIALQDIHFPEPRPHTQEFNINALLYVTPSPSSRARERASKKRLLEQIQIAARLPLITHVAQILLFKAVGSPHRRAIAILVDASIFNMSLASVNLDIDPSAMLHPPNLGLDFQKVFP